jgi:hypothetical protein
MKEIDEVVRRSRELGEIEACIRVHRWLNALGHYDLANRILDIMEKSYDHKPVESAKDD